MIQAEHIQGLTLTQINSRICITNSYTDTFQDETMRWE